MGTMGILANSDLFRYSTRSPESMLSRGYKSMLVSQASQADVQKPDGS